MAIQRPSEQLTLYVSPEEKQKIQDWAEAEERSVSYLLRAIVLKALKERSGERSSGS